MKMKKILFFPKIINLKILINIKLANQKLEEFDPQDVYLYI